MKTLLRYILLITLFAAYAASSADDCPKNIQDQHIKDVVTEQCLQSLDKTNQFMTSVVSMLDTKNISSITDTVNGLKKGITIIANTGNKMTNSFIYAVAGFFDAFSPLYLFIFIFLAASIAKLIFDNRNKADGVKSLIFEKLYQFFISLGVSLAYMIIVGIVIAFGWQFSKELLLNAYYTNLRNIEAAASIKDEIEYEATQKTNTIIADVLKVSSCEYKREKEIAFNTSFDANNKFKEGKFQTCLIDQKNADVQANIKGYFVSENMRKLSTCAMTEESVQTLNCGAVATTSTSAEIESAFALAGPLLIRFNYMLDNYVCTNTKEIMDNQSHYTNGKDCVDFNPYTKQFTITDTGLPKFTEQKIAIDQLNSLVDQIHTVILTGNISVATKRASEVEFDKNYKVTMWSLLVSLLNEHEKVTALKDAARTGLDYQVSFVDTIQYNQAQASVSDDEQIARGGQTKLNKSLRTEQVIDELVAGYAVRDKGVDAVASWIATVGGAGYLENIGYNTESLHDFNTISSMISATTTVFKQSITYAAASKMASSIVAKFGTQSDSEIPNTTAIKIEKTLGFIGTVFGWIALTSFTICVILLVTPLKMIFTDQKIYAITVLKAVTIFPIMIFFDMFFGKASWKEAIIERIMVLFYLFAKIFFMWYKIILVFIIVYLIHTEMLRALNNMQAVLGLFGVDNESISGLLSRFVYMVFMMVLTAWVIAKTYKTVNEQSPQIETAAMFGSGSSMNFNINGKSDRNAFNSYVRGGR